jgi:hypothetical protein
MVFAEASASKHAVPLARNPRTTVVGSRTRHPGHDPVVLLEPMGVKMETKAAKTKTS